MAILSPTTAAVMECVCVCVHTSACVYVSKCVYVDVCVRIHFDTSVLECLGKCVYVHMYAIV